MNKTIFLIAFILVVCNGERATPILDAIINGATRVRDRIHTAGSFIDSLTHGHRGMLNIGGNFQVNKEPPRPPHRPGPNGYGPGPNGYGPGPNGYGPGPNGYGPGPNGYGPRPIGDGPGSNGHTPGYPGRPGYNQNPNNNNQYQNNGPNYGQNNQNYENDKNQPYTVNNMKQENMPKYNNANNDKKPSGDGETSQGGNNNDDGPIRVPLNPNEVNYGGEKTENINAPKRETSKNNDAADDDQEYNIDIRFSNND